MINAVGLVRRSMRLHNELAGKVLANGYVSQELKIFYVLLGLGHGEACVA
jgi:hypothetical protein